jgi:hypothetical protein
MDVLHALHQFIEEITRHHPKSGLPVLYGNCQAGWAMAILAADCVGIVGPAVLNGSPLSYWAGEPSANSMRVMGALTGGAWLVHFLSDSVSAARFSSLPCHGAAIQSDHLAGAQPIDRSGMSSVVNSSS